ncbi:MAG: DUF6677 family protein [Thermoanaerobaculia bacterium]
MSDEERPDGAAQEEPAPDAPALSFSRALGTLAAGFLVPGLGHMLLGRIGRGVAFLLLVLAAVATGVSLEGNLYRVLPGQPLTLLATLGSMGMGLPYFVLRWAAGYQGDVTAAGYEYGTAFLLTGGLMNLLLLLDVWDISRGRKG